ncbi:MAG TPA: cupin domain-containing protein [Gaiellaceae bacterium]|nr:cupin domain-containing protein [Gaiellaceae bacterium]
MAAGIVTTVDRALGTSGNGSATTLSTDVLEQRVDVVAPGAREARTIERRSEVVFVAGGAGVLRVAGEEHPVAAGTGAFLGVGDSVELEAGDDGLQLVVAVTPGAEPRRPDARPTVSIEEREARDAGIGREFHLLVGPEHGCGSVTQFLGLIPPGRAKMHNHPYDEVAYVVEGSGVLHWHEGPSVPVGRGSCIHFPRLVFHSLENVGETPIRIMGVFHPAGSPADRVEVLDY